MSAHGGAEALNVHASAIVLGESGLLIRGRSGAGKTRLALALVEEGRRGSGFARLVADDRTLLARHGTRLVARPHPALAGRVERRGLGIVTMDHEPACVLGLVVDLVDGEPDRVPEAGALHCEIGGVALPRLAVAAGCPPGWAVPLVQAAARLHGTAPCPRPYFACQFRRDAQDCDGLNRRAGNLPGKGMSGSLR